jgi:hypothetical protein
MARMDGCMDGWIGGASKSCQIDCFLAEDGWIETEAGFVKSTTYELHV